MAPWRSSGDSSGTAAATCATSAGCAPPTGASSGAVRSCAPTPWTGSAPRPTEVETVRLPLDGVHDREFWDVWSTTPAFGTPAYYAPWLERFPERAVAAVRAVAHAAPGGVVVHCGLGRDRAGLVTLLLLSLLGVPADVIAADHALSGEDDDEVVGWYAAAGTSREDAVEVAVRAARVALEGLTSEDRGALCARML